MNRTPQGVRPHILILGKVNVGKSTLINALTNQTIALVSEEPGTTTDPVRKSMELLPYGPVVMIDTAGLDDPSALGRARGELTQKAINKADLAVLVTETSTLDAQECALLDALQSRGLPAVVVQNVRNGRPYAESSFIQVNALSGENVEALKETLVERLRSDYSEPPLVSDRLQDHRPVLLVTPIDSAAPKGRLILPQVQTLRDIIDAGIPGVVCRETELLDTLAHLKKAPQLVITDSQVFDYVADVLPASVPLTSFSILMARYKGDLAILVEGARAVERLQPGDRVLIAEACTHHRQADDIGTVKIPRWLTARVGGPLEIDFTAGTSFPDDDTIASYDLVVHCGACMTNRRDMLSRIADARAASVPIVNYGVLLAYLNGILARALAPLGPDGNEPETMGDARIPYGET